MNDKKNQDMLKTGAIVIVVIIIIIAALNMAR
jgi:hypothetical protein